MRKRIISLQNQPGDKLFEKIKLWHLSREGMDLEDPANEPLYYNQGFLRMSVSLEKAPDKPTYVTIDFEKRRSDGNQWKKWAVRNRQKR